MSRSLDHVYSELKVVETKYADERSKRGLVMADAINLWIGDRHQRSRRRLLAARAFLGSTSTVGRPRAVGRAVEALIWPTAFRLRDGRRLRDVPPDWITEAETWLAPMRALQATGRADPESAET